MQPNTHPITMNAGRSLTCAFTEEKQGVYAASPVAAGGMAEPAARSLIVHKQTLIFTDRSRVGWGGWAARCVWAGGVVLGWVLDTTPPPHQSSALAMGWPVPGCLSDFGEAAKADPEGVRGRFALFHGGQLAGAVA